MAHLCNIWLFTLGENALMLIVCKRAGTDKLFYLQMPVVMIPIHFDRDPLERKTSTLRSFVLRPFLTNDFMTGTAALPGRDIPEKVIFTSFFVLE